MAEATDEKWPCNLLLYYILVREAKHCRAIGQNNIKYGNTGCGVFKGGIQNQRGIWLKINCSQMKSLYFANWCNGEVSKSHPNLSDFFY